MLCSEEEDTLLYKEFTNRFLPVILDECKRICLRRKLDSHIGIQIAHETFERVRKYKSFKRDEITVPNNRKAILVYLLRISTRLFTDHHRKQKSSEIIHKTYFDDIYNSINIEVDVKALKNKKDLAELIFGKLNAKEKRVVTMDLEYKKHQKYLPDDISESLSIELGVKKNTITKTIIRAMININIFFIFLN